jgi:hypothetical protein
MGAGVMAEAQPGEERGEIDHGRSIIIEHMFGVKRSKNSALPSPFLGVDELIGMGYFEREE